MIGFGWLAGKSGDVPAEVEAAEPRDELVQIGTLECVSSQEIARAGYAIDLASTFGVWVHRRVETFEFPDADTVRRRMSVDFTLPADDSLEASDQIYVPLMILKREILRNFDVMDEEGTRLNVLITAEHRRVAVIGLHKFLARAWQGRDQLAELLEGLVDETGEVAAVEEEGSKWKRALERGLGDGAQAEALAALRDLLGNLENGFLLLVCLEYRPGERRLIKFSYDSALYPSDLSPIDRIYRGLTRAGSSLGWFPWREEFEDIQVGWAQSYHMEVAPPADTRVAQAALKVGDEGAMRDTSHRLLRPHLAVHDRTSQESAELSLLLQPRRGVLILPLLFAAVVIAVILVMVPEHRSSLDSQTLGALLLVPFALSAFYVRPGEHSYVTKSIQGLRLIAAVPVLAGVLVLALLAFGSLDGVRDSDSALAVARWAARASVGAAYLLSVAFVVPTLGVPSRAVIRYVQRRASGWNIVSRTLVSVGLAAIFVLPLGAVAWWVYSVLPW